MGLRRTIGRWPKQAALILNDRESSMNMLIRDLLRKYGWKGVDTRFPDCEFGEVRAQLSVGAAAVIVVDDSENLPSALTCRRLIQDRVALVTPTLVLLNESNRAELEALQNLGPFEVVQKPVTLGNFNSAFEAVMKRWSAGPWERLRQAGYDLVSGNEKSAIATLLDLNKQPGMAGAVAPCLARILKERGENGHAEKVLLSALKNNPKHLGIMLGLVDLYLHQGMVDMAHRILNGVERLYMGSLTPVLDKIQAALMANKTDLCVAYFQEMTHRGFASEMAAQFQPRVFMAEGLLSDMEKCLRGNANLSAKYRAIWGGRSLLAG